jgi:hypothetical protein
MRWVRLWLPLGIIAGGVVAIVATGGSDVGWEGGAAIIGAGLSVWLLNFFFRVGVQGDRERDAEDAARDYYAEHGRWPDEEPAAPPEEPGAAPRTDPHRTAPPHPHTHEAPGRGAGSTRRRPRRP